ncbi:SCND3 protein, partial [Polyodon spathula]|nr:SCND3 protein [Polyodon spathula]
IARAKKPYTIGEELVFVCWQNIVSVMLGNDTAKKLNMLSLSNDTVKRRICEMSEDIKDQVVNKIQHSVFGMFSLQHDKTTDVIDVIYAGDVKDEFLFSVNFIKTHALNSRLFRELCNELGGENEVLLYHTQVQWLSRGWALKRVFVFHEQMAEFFLQKEKQELNKAKFSHLPLSHFWCSVASEYPLVAEMALRVLLPFSTTYKCESRFTSLLTIKTKSRNRLDVKDDIRATLSNTVPRIQLLVSKKLHHPSY